MFKHGYKSKGSVNTAGRSVNWHITFNPQHPNRVPQVLPNVIPEGRTRSQL